jgi:hypothetical protein
MENLYQVTVFNYNSFESKNSKFFQIELSNINKKEKPIKLVVSRSGLRKLLYMEIQTVLIECKKYIPSELRKVTIPIELLVIKEYLINHISPQQYKKINSP